jgi:hypothetical protein
MYTIDNYNNTSGFKFGLSGGYPTAFVSNGSAPYFENICSASKVTDGK